MSLAARHAKLRRMAAIALDECERMVGQAHHQDDADNFRFECERWREMLQVLDAPNVEQEAELVVFTRGKNPKPHRARATLKLVSKNG